MDRIAAGEVVERPASAVKELVENALDAGATRIEIVLEGGGRRLIRVVDDGAGMSPDDLDLAVERHATSKLPDGDLFNIATLGFRGEALPSIASVARLTIATRQQGAPHGSSILVDAGLKHPVRPSGLDRGTRVEVADLFFATPARLKFLRTDRAEAQAVADVVKRLAMANPGVRFALGGEGVPALDFAVPPGEGGPALAARLGQVLGRDFVQNSLPLDAEREEVFIAGFAGLPTFHTADSGLRLPVRQRSSGARQAPDRRREGGLRRRGALWPSPGRGAVHLLPGLCGGCERASRQERGPLPRAGARARAGRGSNQADIGECGAPRHRIRWPHARSMRCVRLSRRWACVHPDMTRRGR